MFYKENGGFVFRHGKKNFKKAKEAALQCVHFKLDSDEDELLASSKSASCYNCLFRRWNKESFTCMKKGIYAS